MQKSEIMKFEMA